MRDRLILLALILAGGWLLHVPTERVPLLYDMLGYSAQALSLSQGEGNTIQIGDAHLPGIYPAGVPWLASIPMRLFGEDMRLGVLSILACAVLTLWLVASASRRVAGSAAGMTALLLVLCSPLFRSMSGYTMSQVPTALAVILGVVLYVQLESRLALALAGFVAVSSLLFRFANVTFPVALIGAELLLGGLRPRGRIASLALLGSGMAVAAAGVLAHNAWANGGAFVTGYDLWGWDVSGQLSWNHVFNPTRGPTHAGDALLLRSFAGLSGLQSVPAVLAAFVGLWACWRATKGQAKTRLLAGACVATVFLQYALLAGYAFRSDSYLVPIIPLMAVLGGIGAVRLLPSARAWIAPVGAGVLLAVSLWQASGPSGADVQEVTRYRSLARAGEVLEPDAVLLTTSDAALAEPLVRTGPDRELVYMEPFVAHMLRQFGLEEFAERSYRRPADVVPFLRETVASGRPVYFDQNPTLRGLWDTHRSVREEILATFQLVPTDAENVFRLVAKRGG
jgi:4-amino-4-deoxy-L-arabinose transferase-like glycosyltransferase